MVQSAPDPRRSLRDLAGAVDDDPDRIAHAIESARERRLGANRKRFPSGELRKQISLYMSVPDWALIRGEAARRNCPATDVFRDWIEPHLAALRAASPADEREAA